jgi:hypothetical protein
MVEACQETLEIIDFADPANATRQSLRQGDFTSDERGDVGSGEVWMQGVAARNYEMFGALAA